MRFVSLVVLIHFVNLKSGIGSCIAPKAGLARRPAKGMYRAGMFLTFWLAIVLHLIQRMKSKIVKKEEKVGVMQNFKQAGLVLRNVFIHS